MLTRILNWFRRVWREATRPEEEYADDKALFFAEEGIRNEANEPGNPTQYLVAGRWQTLEEFQASRRALLDAYQPQPVRGPDPVGQPPRVYKSDCPYCHGTGSCDAGEDAGGNHFAEECDCWE